MSQATRHLIIVGREGWGNTDFVEYARLSECKGIKVHYIGYKAGRNIYYQPDFVEVIPCGPVVFSIRAFLRIREIIKKHREDSAVIHVRYYKGASILALLLLGSATLDIRSASIKDSEVSRRIENFLIAVESRAFLRSTIVSDAIARLLGVRGAVELPLGAPSEFLSVMRRQAVEVDELKFVYVGTLMRRQIDVFASAFAKFVQERSLGWQLDVYGYGSEADIAKLSDIAGCVAFQGYLAREAMRKVLSNYDVGVSYVPMRKCFDNQPPTKTYEYLMLGMPTIATRTSANKAIMKDDDGWFCDDGPNSIFECLEKVLEEFPYKVVDRDALRTHTWEAIFDRIYRDRVLEIG